MTRERTGDPTDHREGLEALRSAVLDGPGVTSSEVRRGAAGRRQVPDVFATYVDTVHDHAYRVSDQVVTDLRAAGATEDEVFEITVAAAFGAARDRLEAGLAALRAPTEATS